MKLCVPVLEDKGLQSEINPHFGSSALFMVVDTESGICRSIANQAQHHEHGQCQPVQSISGESIDGVVVGGIGKGALLKLRAAGIQVFLSAQHTIKEVVAEYKSKALQAATTEECCGHHGGDGHNCSTS